jgi:hypothetical protein
MYNKSMNYACAHPCIHEDIGTEVGTIELAPFGLTDLVWEKNIVSSKKNKLKNTDYKPDKQDLTIEDYFGHEYHACMPLY